MLAGGNKIEQDDADRQRLIARDPRPKLAETRQQKAGFARFLKDVGR
jgi:hypothetical protein